MSKRSIQQWGTFELESVTYKNSAYKDFGHYLITNRVRFDIVRMEKYGLSA